MSLSEQAYKKLCDLQIQAMLFDMDIDIESWSLVEKSDHEQPEWLLRWQDKRDKGDFDEYIDIDR